MCIRVPVKKHAVLVLCDVQGFRAIYIDCKYYYLVFRAERTLRWRHLGLAPGVLNRWRHTHPILIITYMTMLFYVKQLLTNRKTVQTAWMTKINYIPASHGQVQPTKLAIRLFLLVFWWWFAVVCLLFIVFTANRLKFWWFAVVCGGLRWFVMVCGGLSYSHTRLPGKAKSVVIFTLAGLNIIKHILTYFNFILTASLHISTCQHYVTYWCKTLTLRALWKVR